MRRREKALILFVKNPILGKVKTRLAAGIGERAALRAYRLMLLHLRKLINELKGIDVYVYYSDSLPDVAIWAESVKLEVQVPGDIGEKMSSAFRQMSSQYEKCILIGSDCPDLQARHIKEGFKALESADVVIGPANDGGYYLIGMKDMNESIFQLREWSTSYVCEETIEKIVKVGLTCIEIDELQDVDYEENWTRVKDFLEANYSDALSLFKNGP